MTESPADRFARNRTMHRFTARRLEVIGVGEVERFVRVTLASDELGDWASTGPGDHAKIFFPDPETGVLNAPTATSPTESGIERPEGTTFGRDFTPLNLRDDPETGRRLIDLDILRHDSPGPAARWGLRAEPGDELVMVGPRGSIDAATGAPRLLCFADETALPAVARWIEDMPGSTEIEVVADVEGDLGWARAYLSAQGGREVEVSAAPRDADGLATAARSSRIDDGTYVFAAGEAGRLIPIRRYLRRELSLPREQFTVSGYWKRGSAAFDHHAPIDPDDPED